MFAALTNKETPVRDVAGRGFFFWSGAMVAANWFHRAPISP